MKDLPHRRQVMTLKVAAYVLLMAGYEAPGGALGEDG